MILRKLCQKIVQIIEQDNLDQLPIQQTIIKLQEKASKEEVAHLATVWWCVWFVRNKQIFDPDSESHPLQIEDICKRQIQDWLRAKKWEEDDEEQYKTKERRMTNKNTKDKLTWKPSSVGFSKINFDGSCRTNGEMSGGTIIRNHDRTILYLAVNKFGSGTAIQAETLALKRSIEAARELRLRKIHIEGDSQILINALKGSLRYPWEIDILVTDIGFLLRSFDSVILSFVPREINSVADYLAK